jgi:signal transduction histidine kinase
MRQERHHQLTAVTQLVETLLSDYETLLDSKNISLETDLEPINARINLQLVKSATQGLFDNAIEAMPSGGEMSVSLINGNHHWELEVADTSEQRQTLSCDSSAETACSIVGDSLVNQELPKIMTVSSTEKLQTAYRAASAHGGEIQTWNCPLGGLAHVLVIPRSRIKNTAENSPAVRKPINGKHEIKGLEP